jgi:probable HAF family extracellular repeat protein
MTSSRLAFLAAVAAILPGLAAQAQTTKFAIKPIVIAGDDNVQATALNDAGVIVGSLYAGITDTESGFSIAGNTYTMLPAPNTSGNGFNPRAIDAAGNIFGWGHTTIGSAGAALTYYLSNNGTYNTSYQSIVVAPGSFEAHIIPVAMGLNAKGEVFFNTIYSLSGPVGSNYGKPPNYRSAPPVDRFTEIESLNLSGEIVVEGFSFNGVTSLFVGSGQAFTQVLPAGSINTRGGLLNDGGSVAGSYTDASRALHGFVYRAGAYKTFDMPEAASAIFVTAINNSGRVVGTYTARSNGKQHGFLYNESTVSTFGAFAGPDTVKLAINNKGAIVVADQIYTQTPKYLSYRVSCSGAGC